MRRALLATLVCLLVLTAAVVMLSRPRQVQVCRTATGHALTAHALENPHARRLCR